MIDQAAALRDLVRRQSDARQADSEGGALPLALVVGAKGGVGATTVAVQLAVGLAQLGVRPLLVDADLYRADAATLCGVRDHATLVDADSGRCSLESAIRPGPAGVGVLPGIWAPGRPVAVTDATWRRVRRAFDRAADRIDRVVIDSGSGNADVRRKMWIDAQDVIVVTRPQDLAVMDAYATIKIMRGATEQGQPTRLHLVVNGAASTDQAADVFRRIDQSCRRFLGLQLNDLGTILEQPALQSTREGLAGFQLVPDCLELARRFQHVTTASEEAAA